MRLHNILLGVTMLVAPCVAFAQTTTTTPTTTPGTTTTAPAMAAPAKMAPPAMSAPSTAPMSKTSKMAPATGSVAQYSTVADATAKCTGDTVVWANPKSKALHTSGTRYFGKSKQGFYTCEKDAVSAGYHMAGSKKAKKAKKA